MEIFFGLAEEGDVHHALSAPLGGEGGGVRLFEIFYNRSAHSALGSHPVRGQGRRRDNIRAAA